MRDHRPAQIISLFVSLGNASCTPRSFFVSLSCLFSEHLKIQQRIPVLSLSLMETGYTRFILGAEISICNEQFDAQLTFCQSAD